MEIEIKKRDVGVIVARFQVDILHLAHLELVDHVLKQHNKVLIFLGTCVPIGTRENPLNFTDRKQMIEEKYGNKVVIMPMPDMKLDQLWSDTLDGKIREVFPRESIVLYGSRDSFADHYLGKFDVIKLAAVKGPSGTDVRNRISKDGGSSAEERRGKIKLAYEMYAKVHPCIDAVILKGDKVLLGRKKNEFKLRFIGGFIDVEDENAEETVKREVAEETGIEVSAPKYLMSKRIDDWRYRGIDLENIMTFVYAVDFVFGNPTAADDIEEVVWMDIKENLSEKLVAGHSEIWEKCKLWQ